MRGDDLAVAALAESVADGTPIDWQTVEQQGPRIKRLARHLRLVDSIAALHRSTPTEEAVPIRRDPHGAHERRWGRLVLLETIGSGASCDVYRAWDAELHRDVALKLLHEPSHPAAAGARPGALESRADGDQAVQTRVLQEARRMARLRHEHVVHVYGSEQHDGRVGLWMELVRGTSLEELVQQRGSFSANEAALIGLDVCAALAAVHGAGLLHRDVKAQNVMREAGGRIVLMDFGTGEDLAGTNRLVGTPLYLAPEIFAGERASVQSDVYAVGVLLFYLVTGTFPLTARLMEELAEAHRQGNRRSLRDLRPDAARAFVAVVERALDSDPSRRFRSVGELETALREAIDAPESATVAVPATSAQHSQAPRRRGIAFIAVASLLLAGAVGLSWWGRSVQARRGAVLSAIRTIAVMPATAAGTLGADAEPIPDHVARGFTDELLATLGQTPSLRIKSGAIRGVDGRSHQELARALDVDALLETTMASRSGSGAEGSIVASTRLIAAGSGQIVWGQQFRRERGDLQGLQHDIAAGVARAVSLAGPIGLGGQRHYDPAAQEAYLLGRSLIDHYGAGSADRALKAFDRARRLDAGHAGANVGAARAIISLGLNGTLSHQTARAQATADINRALELDPNSAEGLATLAYISFVYDWNWAPAERAFRRSLEINPSLVYARTVYAEFLAAMGRGDEAVEHALIARHLEPESGIAARRFALVHYYKGDFTAAERALAEAALIEPDSPGIPLFEGRVLAARGRYPEALAATERASQLMGVSSVPVRVEIVRLLALSGRHADALAQYAELERQAATRAIRFTDRDRAYIEFALGHTDKGFQHLARAIDDREPSIVWVGVDARLASLRGDDRFKQLMTAIGLPLMP